MTYFSVALGAESQIRGSFGKGQSGSPPGAVWLNALYPNPIEDEDDDEDDYEDARTMKRDERPPYADFRP